MFVWGWSTDLLSSDLHEDDREAPDERRDDQEQEGQARAEGRDGVLDAVGTAADVEEDDGGYGKEPEFPPEARRRAPRGHASLRRLQWPRESARVVPSATRRRAPRHPRGSRSCR